MNKCKKLASIFILMVVWSIIFTACEKQEKRNASLNNIEDRDIYQASFQDTDVFFDEIVNSCMKDDCIYIIGKVYTEGKKEQNTISKTFLVGYTLDRRKKEQIEIMLKKNEYICCLEMDNKNQFHILIGKENYDKEKQKNKQKYFVYTINKEGNIIETYKLQWNKQRIDDIDIKEENIFISFGSEFYIFDLQGKQKKRYDFKSDINDFVQMENGQVYLYGKFDNKWVLKKLDIETETFKEDISFDSYNIHNGTTMCAGWENEIYISDENNMYCLELSSGNLTILFSWINNGITCDNIQNYFLKKGGSFLVVNTSYSNKGTKLELISLEKVKMNSIKEKTFLKLFCVNAQEDMKEEVLSFNRTNANYQIELRDYSVYADAQTQLNLDIASGDIPDILDMSFLPALQYIKKGLLADLYPFMEKDKEIKKEDFINSIIDTIEIDKKLYYIDYVFNVNFLLGSKRDLGDKKSLTFEDMKDLYDDMEKDGLLIERMTRQGFIQRSFEYCPEDYINWKTGEVTMDSENFIDIIKFSKNFPDEKNIICENQEDLSTMVEKKKLMLSRGSLYNIKEIQMFTKRYQNIGDFTVVSWPSLNGNDGLSMSFEGFTMAITEACHNKEGAWEFLRRFLTYDYQKKIDYALPTRKDALKKKLEYAVATKNYIDEDGTKVKAVESDYFYDGYELKKVKLKELHKEEISLIYSIIDRIDKYGSIDVMTDKIEKIITEEVESFYKEDKTAEEVVQIIQNRVSIYISENL